MKENTKPVIPYEDGYWVKFIPGDNPPPSNQLLDVVFLGGTARDGVYSTGVNWETVAKYRKSKVAIASEPQPALDYTVIEKSPPAATKELQSSTGTTIDPNSRYYDAGGIETIDIIKAKLTPEQLKGYLLGNVIKYSSRLNFKGSAVRDAEKLNFYSTWLEQLK